MAKFRVPPAHLTGLVLALSFAAPSTLQAATAKHQSAHRLRTAHHKTARHAHVTLAGLKRPDQTFTGGAGDRAYAVRAFAADPSLPKLSADHRFGARGPVASVGYIHVNNGPPSPVNPSGDVHALVGGQVSYPFK